MPFTTPLFTANQGLEIDDFNRRCMPNTKQQDQFEKRVYDPIEILTQRYQKDDLPDRSKFLARPKLKKILGTKPPIAYRPNPSVEAKEEQVPYGRIKSTMPEPLSQRHVNCFDPNYEPNAGENIKELWIRPTVAYGSLNANTQQKILEEKQEASLKKFHPRKWKMDIDNQIGEDKLGKTVASRMKDFGEGVQLPFVPCERVTRIPLRSHSEIWRQRPHRPLGEDETGEKFRLLMSKLHNEEIWTQKMMESTASLSGEGNRIQQKCARQEYITRPLGTPTSWHKDVLSKWSQLHGFAIPHLQTLKENMRLKKTMADSILASVGKTNEPPEPYQNDSDPTAETQSQEEDSDFPDSQRPEDLPPPPGNTPLPPPELPPPLPLASPPADKTPSRRSTEEPNAEAPNAEAPTESSAAPKTTDLAPTLPMDEPPAEEGAGESAESREASEAVNPSADLAGEPTEEQEEERKRKEMLESSGEQDENQGELAGKNQGEDAGVEEIKATDGVDGPDGTEAENGDDVPEPEEEPERKTDNPAGENSEEEET